MMLTPKMTKRLLVGSRSLPDRIGGYVVGRSVAEEDRRLRYSRRR